MEKEKYENPNAEVCKRDYCGNRSQSYEIMMGFLHSDALKTPRLYYCATHHSIETVSTYQIHKNDPNCVIYTKGQFSSMNYIHRYTNFCRQR